MMTNRIIFVAVTLAKMQRSLVLVTFLSATDLSRNER